MACHAGLLTALSLLHLQQHSSCSMLLRAQEAVHATAAVPLQMSLICGALWMLDVVRCVGTSVVTAAGHWQGRSARLTGGPARG